MGGAWIAGLNGLSLKEFIELEDAGASLLLDAFEKTVTELPMVANGYFLWPIAALGAAHDYTKSKSTGDVGALFTDLSEVGEISVEQMKETLRSDKTMQQIVKQTKLVKEAIGDDMFITGAIGAPFTYAGTMLGVEKYLLELMMNEDPENLQKLNDLAVAITIEFAQILFDAGADGIFIADPVASGELISQPMFEEHSLPMLQQTFSALDNFDLRLLHICGNSLARIESLKSLSIHGFSLDSVDIPSAMEKADKQFAILGNLSPFAIIKTRTPQEIINHAKVLIDEAGTEGGFIVCSGCDITPLTPLENVRALADSTRL